MKETQWDTNERFQDVFGTKDFEFAAKCKKCGSTNVDLRFEPGAVYSEYTSEPACLEVWCKNCENRAYES